MTREERRKCKRKQGLSLQRVGEHPLLPVTSQLGRAAATGQGVRRKHSVQDTLPATRRPVGVDAAWAGCRKRGTQDAVPRSLQMPGPALKNWTSANRKPFRPCSRQGFHGNPWLLPRPHPTPNPPTLQLHSPSLSGLNFPLDHFG